MTTMTTKLTTLVETAEERIARMTKDVGDKVEAALAGGTGSRMRRRTDKSNCGGGEGGGGGGRGDPGKGIKDDSSLTKEKGSMADVTEWETVTQRMIWTEGAEEGMGENGEGEQDAAGDKSEVERMFETESNEEELEGDDKGRVKGGDKRESNEGEDKIIEEEFEDQSGEVDVGEENGFKNNFEWQNHGKNIFSKSDFDFKVGKLAATSKSKEEE